MTELNRHCHNEKIFSLINNHPKLFSDCSPDSDNHDFEKNWADKEQACGEFVKSATPDQKQKIVHPAS